MDIVIVAQYMRDIEDFSGVNSRFLYLARMLEKNHEVEIITSMFIHRLKRHAKKIGTVGNINITAVDEPGYPRNICLKRFSSHKALARNVYCYLSNRKKPDAVYVAVPSLAVAQAVSKYCKKNNIRLIVDIQDLWPEAFKMVVNIPVLSDIIFKPMELQADRIYSQADEIVAVSETYANRGMKKNKKCKKPLTVFLGTEMSAFDECAKNAERTDDMVKIAYIGTLGNSYDIKCIIDAIKMLPKRGLVHFVIMGDGDLKKSFENYAECSGISYTFTGALPYPKMVETLVGCHIAVNPIRKGSAGSIINKVGDYAMAGLPVINTQECIEYRTLLENYNAGINCECGNADEVSKAIKNLIDNPALRKEMSENSRRLGKELFDREETYKKIVRLIEDEGTYSKS